jgi:hypothetical protein
MLRFRINQFDRLTPANFVGQQDNLPAPFPGKWPTRIAWKFLGMDVDESYVGKPIRQAAERFQTLQRTVPSVHAYFVEFDRKHRPIYLWSNVTGLQMHPVLYGVYHYWQSYDVAGGHFAVPLYRKRLGGLVVYSPYRALARERKDSWLAYVRSHTPFKPKLFLDTE